MKVSIVIPNWNGEGRLKKNLPKVLQTKGVDEFIVVDDASTDGSVDILKSFKEIKLIVRKENGGFSKAVNTGVKEALGDIVFLLNSDAVPESEAVLNALPHFKDAGVFSVGCNSGGNWSWARFSDGFFWHYQSKGEVVTHQTLWSSGGSGLFRKSIWNELEGLDELFSPFYEEDTDLGYRATKRGYINIWEKQALVEHYKEPGVIEENFSKKKISEVASRNQLYLIWKNITDKDLVGAHIKELLMMILKHPTYLKIVFKAALNLGNVLEKRRKEKQYAKLTDSEILDRYH